MEKNPLNSIRVAYENWLYPDRFDSLLGLLKKYPCGIDQVALFTSAVHTPLPLGELARRAAIMKERIVRLREEGFSGGINILATIGHHNEDLDVCFGGDYYRMTNIDGAVCRGSFCLGDVRYLADYVEPAYRMLAETGPDFIWVDDDVRYGHMPVGNGCFCDGCIARFNREYEFSYTRETLKTALDGGDISLRKKWLKHNADGISRLLALIGRTVRGVSDRITLGFMTGERYFEGYDFAAFADALSDNGKYKIMWRPGGGAYEDRSFDDILAKAQEINRQTAFLPPYVSVIQSEIENFPYQLIKKTPESTASEAALHITAGCTGAAFNILPSETLEPVGNVEEHLKRIDEYAPYYALLSEKLRGMKAEGIHTGWRIDSQAALPEGDWTRMYGGSYAAYARELFSFGLPECSDPARADVVTLTGRSASVMDDGEIKSLLSGGLYLDASALDYLNGRGFGEYTGFAAGRQIPADAREIYTDNEINGGIAGCMRNCRQAFNWGDSFAVIPQYDTCKTLSRLVDYHGGELCACCMGVYENKLGGRVCASGYYPFTWVSDAVKTAQLKRVFAYLSAGRLISFAGSYARLHNFTLTGGGRICCTLCNPSNQTLENVSVYIRSEKSAAAFYNRRGWEKLLKSESEIELYGGKYRLFTVGTINPFETVLIEL